jgi:hypothetical protein
MIPDHLFPTQHLNTFCKEGKRERLIPTVTGVARNYQTPKQCLKWVPSFFFMRFFLGDSGHEVLTRNVPSKLSILCLL